MNIINIINGLVSEGKTSELVDNMVTTFDDKENIMQYITITINDEVETLKELYIDRCDSDEVNNAVIFTGVNTMRELTNYIYTLDEDRSTCIFIDTTDKIDGFDLEELARLVDERQFDLTIARLRNNGTGYKTAILRTDLDTFRSGIPSTDLEVSEETYMVDTITGERFKLGENNTDCYLTISNYTMKVPTRDGETADVHFAHCIEVQNNQDVGKSTLLYMDIRDKGSIQKMELACGEYDDRPYTKYLLTKSTVNEILQMRIN